MPYCCSKAVPICKHLALANTRPFLPEYRQTSSMATALEHEELSILVAALSESAEDPEAVRTTCDNVADLATITGYPAAIVQAGAAPYLLDALHTHAGDARVVAAASNALANLACDPSCRLPIVTSPGGIKLFVTALLTHKGDATAMAAVAGALWNLTRDSSASQIAFRDAGAVPRLLLALTTHAHVAATLKPVLGVLSNLVVDPGAREIAESGRAVRLLTAALAAHGAEDAGVARAACVLLGNIAAGTLPDGRAALAAPSVGAVKGMLAVLSSHKGDASVVEAAAGAIGNVALGGPPARAAIVAEGGVERLLQVCPALLAAGSGLAPRATASAVAALETVAGALGNLAASPDLCAARLDAGGAPQLLKAALDLARGKARGVVVGAKGSRSSSGGPGVLNRAERAAERATRAARAERAARAAGVIGRALHNVLLAVAGSASRGGGGRDASGGGSGKLLGAESSLGSGHAGARGGWGPLAWRVVMPLGAVVLAVVVARYYYFSAGLRLGV